MGSWRAAIAASAEPASSFEWQPFLEGVHRFVAGRVPGQDVDDVVQEVILRIHRGVDGVRDSDKVESWLFAVTRRHEIAEGFLVSGLLFPLTLPATTPWWQAALGISFGVVVAKELFGGVGRNIVNPALAAHGGQ